MAYSPQGGTVTPAATPGNLVGLLVAAGVIAAKAPTDRATQPHYTYHTLVLRAGSGNAATIYWGFGRADGAALSSTNAAGYLLAKDGFTIDCVNGLATLEAIQVLGNASDTLLVSFWE